MTLLELLGLMAGFAVCGGVLVAAADRLEDAVRGRAWRRR